MISGSVGMVAPCPPFWSAYRVVMLRSWVPSYPPTPVWRATVTVVPGGGGGGAGGGGGGPGGGGGGGGAGGGGGGGPGGGALDHELALTAPFVPTTKLSEPAAVTTNGPPGCTSTV